MTMTLLVSDALAVALSRRLESSAAASGFGFEEASPRFDYGDAPRSVVAPPVVELSLREAAAQEDQLDDLELMSLALRMVHPARRARERAQAIAAAFPSFGAALAASLTELRARAEVTQDEAQALKAVRAAAIRLARSEVRNREALSSFDRVVDYLLTCHAREQVERLHVLYLDTRNQLIADGVLAEGTVNHTPVYPREILRRAIEFNATALILAHNHPSGDARPSQDDIEMTREVKRAANALGIVLHDHLIIGDGSWFSFRQKGLL
jgi:DNA repair protein RadC